MFVDCTEFGYVLVFGRANARRKDYVWVGGVARGGWNLDRLVSVQQWCHNSTKSECSKKVPRKQA